MCFAFASSEFSNNSLATIAKLVATCPEHIKSDVFLSTFLIGLTEPSIRIY